MEKIIFRGGSDGTYQHGGFLSESALKDNDFTVKKLDGSPISIYAGSSLIDKIPQFMTTDEQLKNFAPYVELVTSGSQLTGVKWSFVKNKDPKTPADSSYIGSSYKMDISYMGWDGSKRFESFLKRDAALSGDVSFSFPADLGKVWYVSLQLMTNGTEASGGTVYEWVHLINPPAETPKVDFPIETEVGAAKDAAASLLDSAPTSFEAATQGSVISQTSITEDEFIKTPKEYLK